MQENIFIIIIGLDIEGYTNRTIPRQHTAQKSLESWVIEAANYAAIAQDPQEIRWIDTGDGGYIIFETSYVKAVPFLEHFYRLLREANRDATNETIINIRAAVHCADVLYWKGKLGDKYAGNAINVCGRILDGMDRKVSNQVVCSGPFLRRLCLVDKVVEALRLPDHVDKHGKCYEVWNIARIPLFGIKPDEEELHEDPNEWHL